MLRNHIYSHAIISIFSATFCLAQLKLVNVWLKRILGSLAVHFDPVLANKIFWQAKCIFEICIIRCESDEFLHSITDTYSYEDILKIYLAYQKYFVGQNLVKMNCPIFFLSRCLLILAVQDKMLRQWWTCSGTIAHLNPHHHHHHHHHHHIPPCKIRFDVATWHR